MPSDSEPKEISRRKFVGDIAMAGMAFTIVPRHVLGRGYVAPSDKMNVACIGIGGQGESDVKGMADVANIYALCDVDLRNGHKMFNAYPSAKQYRDYREMIDREHANIDAITVTIPDHSHAAATMLALRAGKHVYTQKPLTRTLGEVRAIMREAAARPKQATQMGNQGHANDGTRQIREWIEAGAIGNVQRVEYWTDRPIWPQGLERPTEEYWVPQTLDWNLWLGPAAERPYHPAYMPFKWRGWWDFGTGALGDMACHLLDAAFWTLGLRYPSRVSVETSQTFVETAPKMSRVAFDFPARGAQQAVTLTWRDGGLVPARPYDWPTASDWPFDSSGQLWIGDRGTLVAGTYGEDPRLSDPKRQAELMANPPAQKYPRVKSVWAEWMNAAKAGTQPGSNFPGHSGPLTEVVLLGDLAVRTGKTLEIDTQSGRVTNFEVPEGLITPSYRKGWVL